MGSPPPGYDDSSIIPRSRMMGLVKKMEDDLVKIEKVFEQHRPINQQLTEVVAQDFWNIRHSADQMGTEYSVAVEKFIANYSHFLQSPSPEKLDSLFENIKELQSLLVH